MKLEPGSAYRLDRRRFFQAAAGTAAAASATGALAWPVRSVAHGRDDDDDLTSLPPIPGGIQIPGGPQIHVWVPGDPSVTLPLSGMTLQGFDVDPSTLTDFRGFSAVAFLVGTATGSDGQTYNLEADMRAYQGAYVDSTGARRFGTFGFI